MKPTRLSAAGFPVVGLGGLALALICLGAAGCGGSTAGIRDAAESQTPEQLFESVAASLKEERPAILDTQKIDQQLAPQNVYQHAVQQLNLYLNLRRGDPLKLDPGQRQAVERSLLAGLPRADRQMWLEEIERQTFTELDVLHLDACFLFRDAAQNLLSDLGFAAGRKLSEAEQVQLAREAFERVVRQVDLRPPKPGVDPWPAHEVLRRGTGTAEERSRVFFALLEQLGLDGAYVTRHIEVAGENNQREEQELTWAPAVRIGKELYLFEPSLGKAISGPAGKGVATLNQVRSDPKLLEALGRPGRPYEVKPVQLEKAGLLLPSSLPATAPRMSWLQTRLAESQNRVTLYEDLSAALKRFQEAGLGVEARLWTRRDGYPALLLAKHAANIRRDPRWRNNLEIVPRDVMAPWALAMAARMDPQPDIHISKRWPDEEDDTPPELIADRLQPRHSAPLFEYFDRLFLRLRLEPGGVRDLLVRGKPEQAVDRILWFEQQLDRSQESWRSFENPVPYMRQQWGVQIVKAVEQLRNAMAKRAGSENTSQEFSDLFRRVEGYWLDGQINLRFLSNEWAAAELREHLCYFMALSKMELAVRAELRAERAAAAERAELWTAAVREWQSATDWFSRYQAMIYGQKRSQWPDAVRNHLEICKERLARCKSEKGGS